MSKDIVVILENGVGNPAMQETQVVSVVPVVQVYYLVEFEEGYLEKMESWIHSNATADLLQVSNIIRMAYTHKIGFGLNGAQENIDRFIGRLKKHPAVHLVYLDQSIEGFSRPD